MSVKPAARRIVLALLAVALLAPAAPAAANGDGHDVRSRVAGTGDPSPDVRMRGAGWGHGVGMSQYGAYAQARDGRSVTQILQHYYQGVSTRDSRDFGVDSHSRAIRVGLVQGTTGAGVRVPTSGDRVTWQACTGGGCSNQAVQTGDSLWRAVPRSGGGVVVERQVTGASGAEVSGSSTSDGDLDLEDFPLDEMATGAEPDTGAQAAASELQAASSHWEPVFNTQGTARVVHDTSQARVPIQVPVAGLAGERLYARGFHELIEVDGRISTVQQVPTLEQYLYGLGEVPSSWGTAANGGAAALEAQAITARTFAVDRLRTNGRMNQACRCHLLAGPADQAYSGWTKEIEGGGSLGAIWTSAVDRTRRTVMTHNGQLTGAFYSSSHGGRSENVEDSWAYGTTPISYLRSVSDPYSLRAGIGNRYRAWTATQGNRAMADYLSRGLDGTIRTVEQLTVQSSTRGGTPRELFVRGRAGDGTEVSGVFTRPSADRKAIAAANFRRDLSGVTIVDANNAVAPLTTLPSSQISRIGFAPFDDDDGRVHEYATVWAHQAGIAQGVADDRFAPTRSVTRGQMASFIYRTYDIPASSSDNFRDVDPGDPHGEAINALADAGVAQGYEDGRFRPGTSVTRAQMASFLARAAGLDEVAPDGRFTDVRSGTHAGNIHAIADAGITRGCRSDRYCPDDPVAREQMSSFLYRAVRGER